MRKKLITLFVAVQLFCCLPFLTATGGLTSFVGTDGLNLFQIDLNSRVNGLGGAYCAAAEDISGLSINPAGLAYLNPGLKNQDRKELNFVHLDWLDDTSIEYLAYAQPLFDGTIGGSVTFLAVPSFANYNKYGYSIGNVTFNDTVFSVAYAHRIGQISLGGQLKLGVLSTSADNHTIASFALDTGMQFYVRNLKIRWQGIDHPLNNLKVGISLQNIATKAGPDNVPVKLIAGIYYPILQDTHSLFVTCDMNKTLYSFSSFADLDYRFNLGLEYSFQNMIYVRTGFKLGYDLNFFTIGIGVAYHFGEFDTHVDYVFVPQDRLGDVNNFSINAKFVNFDFRSTFSKNREKQLEILYYKGFSYFVQEDFDKAIETWNKALELDPENKAIKKKIQDAEELKESFRPKKK